MEKLFNSLSEKLIDQLNVDEYLKISINGEHSQFIRFNQSKVRQSGIVEDASLYMNLIKDGKTCSGSFTLTDNWASNEKFALEELKRLRTEIIDLPKDPFIVIPKNVGSSRENNEGNLLPEEEVVSALCPAMKNVDLAGIWSSGRIFSGNANSAGQTHWFSTDTFSLDYSLITKDEKMVKATYAGSNWEQEGYEKFMADSILKLEMMKKIPKKLVPGSYRAYIAPAGVADIIHMFSWGGVGEASIQQGNSSLSKMRKNNV